MPLCTDSLVNSPKAEGMTIKELIGNVYCALTDIATALQELVFLRRCSRIKEIAISESDSLVIGVPFIPIGFKEANSENVFISFIDADTWTITFSNVAGTDETFLYYEL